MNEITLKPNLFELKHRLEIIKGTAFSWSSIAKSTGLHINTLLGLNGGKHVQVRRVDFETLEKLLLFFRSQGMDITLCDLLIEEQTAAPEPEE
jgi:hypothetical protein